MEISPESLVTQFTYWDWGIVAAYLILVVYIGIRVNRYITDVASYMVGGRASRWALNTASYIGTELGLVIKRLRTAPLRVC
ncbi:MAG: hypothetical protein ACC655_02650 [Rhodothermia bacterium]